MVTFAQTLADQHMRMPLRLTIAPHMLDIGSKSTLNASLTRLSSYRKCSKRRILGHSAQATYRLRIEGTTKCSPIVRGFAFGSVTEFAVDKPTAGLRIEGLTTPPRSRASRPLPHSKSLRFMPGGNKPLMMRAIALATRSLRTISALAARWLRDLVNPVKHVGPRPTENRYCRASPRR